MLNQSQRDSGSGRRARLAHPPPLPPLNAITVITPHFQPPLYTEPHTAGERESQIMLAQLQTFAKNVLEGCSRLILNRFLAGVLK